MVPHHGSAFHDISPVFELNPKTAIVAVDPRNRYGHPAPSVLLELMNRLQPDNVWFTGSVGKIEFGPDGVKSGVFRASARESYSLFVLPNELRAAKKTKGKRDAELYAAIRSIMLKDPGVPTSSPLILRPTLDGSGYDTLYDTLVSASSVQGQLARRGTILSDQFEIGNVSSKGVNPEQLAADQIFPRPGVPALARIAVNDNFASENEASLSTLPQVTETFALLGKVPAAEAVDVSFETAAGLTNGLEPSREIVTARLPSASGPAAKAPKGGMVFLSGGQLFPVGSAGDLAGATLDLCGTKLCLWQKGTSPSLGVPYSLPFSLDELFSETWRKAYDEEVEAFYLSINPTQHFLRSLDSRLSAVPSDKLSYGSGEVGAIPANNEVVTLGGIETSIIGEILWKADVAFKSASLGYNVFTGVRLAQSSASLTTQEAGREEDFGTDYKDRWCRLYWTSGAQQIDADSVKHRVIFKGGALRARAEPMRLYNGKLEDYPAGTWCEGPKRVAASLQSDANAQKSAFPELNQLRRLAEMQNFIRWAKKNGIHPTEAFHNGLKPSAEFRVPTWTSGIRTEPRVLIQVERRLASNPWVLRLHFGATDIEAIIPCIEKVYGPNARDKALRAMGIQRDESGVWRYGDQHKHLLLDWMTNVATAIATCAKGRVLSPSGERPENDEFTSSLGEVGDLVPHPMPLHVHGGVLLGSFSAAGRKQLHADGALILLCQTVQPERRS